MGLFRYLENEGIVLDSTDSGDYFNIKRFGAAFKYIDY